MNIIDIQDRLKDFSEDQLVKEMQMPSGTAPQFLVLSEINRRKRVRDDYTKQQAANEMSVAEEAIAAGGVPQSGIAGMSEAMAPQSSIAQGGVGTAMNQAMRPSPMPQRAMSEEEAMGMRSGGLMAYGRELADRMGQEKIDPFLDEVESMASNRFGVGSQPQPMVSQQPYIAQRPGFMGRPFTARVPFDVSQPTVRDPRFQYNTLRDNIGALPPPQGKGGIAQIMPAQAFQSGGVIKAQSGTFFPSTPYTYGIYGAETSLGKNIVNRPNDGIGPFQIKPDTAISPGYGIKSLFPGIQRDLESGKYKDINEAIAKNKDLITERLMDPVRSEGFALDFYNNALMELGDPDLATIAYNTGIEGARSLEGDPKEHPYYQKVSGFSSEYQPKGGEASDPGEGGLSDSEFIEVRGDGTVIDTSREGKQRPIGDLTYGQRLRDLPEGGYVFGTGEDLEILGDTLPPEARREMMLGVQEGSNWERMYKDMDPDDTLGTTYGMGAIDTPVTGTLDAAQQAEVLAMDPTQINRASDSPVVMPSEKQLEGEDLNKAAQAQADSATTALADALEYTTSEEYSGIAAEIKDLQDMLKKEKDSDKWLALAQAGMQLMSSKEPTLMGALGEAGITGLGAMREAQSRYQEGVIDLINARAKLSKGISESDAAATLQKTLEALGEVDDLGEFKIQGGARTQLEALARRLSGQIGSGSSVDVASLLAAMNQSNATSSNAS